MMVASASSPLDSCPVFRHGGCSPPLRSSARKQQQKSPKASPNSVLDHKRFVAAAALLSSDRSVSPPPLTSHGAIFSSNTSSSSSFAKPPMRRCKSLPNLNRNRTNNNNFGSNASASGSLQHRVNLKSSSKGLSSQHKRVMTRAGGENRSDSLPLFWFRPSPEAPTGRKAVPSSSPNSLKKRKAAAGHVRHQSLKFPLPKQQPHQGASSSRHTRHHSLMPSTAIMESFPPPPPLLPPSGRPLSPTARPLSPVASTTPPPPPPADILSQVRLKSSELQGLSFVEEDEE